MPDKAAVVKWERERERDDYQHNKNAEGQTQIKLFKRFTYSLKTLQTTRCMQIL